MQKDVTQGKSYCLTVYSVPCKVTAIGKDNIEYTLLNVSETGQYLFIAPTWKVNISQDDASIVETFNLAGTGKVGGSGSGSDPTYGLLKIIFVDALPPISEAKENTLYFVPKNGSAPDNYDEYIFDPVNQQFELVGQSAIDTSDFAKLSSTNIFLAPNTFDEIITFKKGLKVSESGPVITSNDTTLNLPNTSTPLLKAQGLILNGVSTFNNKIRVPTISDLTSTPIKVTSAVDFTSNSDTNFSGNINTPNINVTDLVTIASSKIQTNDLGEFIIGQNIQTPTTANNGAHRFTATDINKTAIALGHKIVKNGTWATGWVILTDRWDFTYNGEAILQVKEPKTDKEAANKLYVDTQINAISQFDPSSDQTISGTWEFTKPLKVTEAQLANEAVSKGYVDTSLSSKANSADVYTKTDCDSKFATKTEVTAIKATADAAAPQSTTYTKTESDSKYATKTEVSAIKTTADNAAPQSITYTKTDCDGKFATITSLNTVKATADAAAPQSTTYTKTEVDTSLNTTVKLTGNQTVAGVKTFTDNVKIPSPQANDDAASKEYVDALYIPKTGNSDIGGIKTFTDGIILADEKQLQLGAGTGALKIHGTGNGKAVIEGSNISELDIAVPVNIQENLQVENLTVDITNRGLVDFITFQNEAASLSNMQFFIDSSTNNIGIKPADSDGGFQVQNNGWLVALSTFQANGSFISQGGATFSQSITVAGTATLNNGISLKNGITFYDNTSLQEAKIIGEYGSPDESAIIFADSASVDYLKFNHHSANKQVLISPQVSGDTIVFPELPESTVTPTNINQFTNKNYVDETIQQNLNTTLEGVIKFVSMTEAEYKALETKSPSTIYHLTDVSMWAIGDQEIVTSNMPA